MAAQFGREMNCQPSIVMITRQFMLNGVPFLTAQALAFLEVYHDDYYSSVAMYTWDAELPDGDAEESYA